MLAQVALGHRSMRVNVCSSNPDVCCLSNGTMVTKEPSALIGREQVDVIGNAATGITRYDRTVMCYCILLIQPRSLIAERVLSHHAHDTEIRNRLVRINVSLHAEGHIEMLCEILVKRIKVEGAGLKVE